MTVPYPLDAFETDRLITLRPSRPPVDKGKITGIALTVIVHAAVLAGLLTAVHVSHTRVMQELSVAIIPEVKKHEEVLAPPPRLEKPLEVTVPPPEFTIRQAVASPVTVTPPPPRPAAPAATKTPVAGEGRDSFLGRLLAQLNRYKQYPRAARKAHIEGVVMLHFVMDAEGRVTSAEIAKSSGRPVLDNEALALIQRAQPLPALPADYPTRTLDAIVPIEFYLDR
jgi:protein TonB